MPDPLSEAEIAALRARAFACEAAPSLAAYQALVDDLLATLDRAGRNDAGLREALDRLPLAKHTPTRRLSMDDDPLDEECVECGDDWPCPYDDLRAALAPATGSPEDVDGLCIRGHRCPTCAQTLALREDTPVLPIFYEEIP